MNEIGPTHKNDHAHAQHLYGLAHMISNIESSRHWNATANVILPLTIEQQLDRQNKGNRGAWVQYIAKWYIHINHIRLSMEEWDELIHQINMIRKWT